VLRRITNFGNGALVKVEAHTYFKQSAKFNKFQPSGGESMTNVTPPAHKAPVATVSMNDTLPTSSPSPKSALIGLACVVGFIAVVTLVVIYYQAALS
jgi:hypothetical protein